MKSLIVFLMLSLCHNISFAGVDGWRMNQFTGKPDYYQIGVDSSTLSAIAASTTSLAIQTAALDVSTQTLELTKISADKDVNLNGHSLTAAGITASSITLGGVEHTSWPGGASLSDFNIWQSSNIFNSILMSTGTHGSGGNLDTAGAGTRFFFYPKKSAIRAGQVSGTIWNEASIGDHSVGFGYDCLASGQYSSCSGAGNSSTYFGASTLGGTGNQATAQSSIVAGGDGSSATGSRSAVLGGYVNNAIGSHATVAGGSANLASGDYAVTLGGNNITSSGVASGAGGQWAQNAADYSFVWGNYVGLGAGADGSMLFGYDTSSVKTYTESGKFYIHGLDLRVSSSTTAAVQYGLTKEGAATVDSISVTAGVVASTVTTTSTTTAAALAVTGAAAFSSAISTTTFSGWVSFGLVAVSSSCAGATVAVECTATCPEGTFIISGGHTSNGNHVPYYNWMSGYTQWVTDWLNTAGATVISKAICARVKW